MPLTIVMIANLGKFFSEFTVRSYLAYLRKKRRLSRCLRYLMKQLRLHFNNHPNHSGHTKHRVVNANTVEARSDCEDQLNEECQAVPVVVVCGVLVGYIGFGALLFARLEGWSYLEGFYFCFITLTTVGFGRISDFDIILFSFAIRRY